MSVGCNRNITQFDFPEDHNCENCENYYIEGFFFINFIFGLQWTSNDTPGTETKLGRVFPMVILSEFRLIYSNKEFAKINFAIFAKIAICEIAIFAISQITQLDFEPILQPCGKVQLFWLKVNIPVQILIWTMIATDSEKFGVGQSKKILMIQSVHGVQVAVGKPSPDEFGSH